MAEYPMAKGITVWLSDISASDWLLVALSVAQWGRSSDGRYLHATLRDKNMIDLSRQPAAAIQQLAGQITHIALIDMSSRDEI
jgi:hypothetical protein